MKTIRNLSGLFFLVGLFLTGDAPVFANWQLYSWSHAPSCNMIQSSQVDPGCYELSDEAAFLAAYELCQDISCEDACWGVNNNHPTCSCETQGEGHATVYGNQVGCTGDKYKYYCRCPCKNIC